LTDRIAALTDWDAHDIDATPELRERVREALNRANGDFFAKASGAPGGCFARRLSVKDCATVLRGGRAGNRTVESCRKV
jgi:hypothetical protein